MLNTYTLIIIHSPALSFSQRIRYALRFFVVSTPLILFLFTLIPRLDPLWKMPSSKGTSTGLSENINPGDFSNLARSPDLAFRATFDTPVPAQKNLYWRTMVHEAFDGKQWTIHPFRKTKQNVIPIKFPHADIKDNVFSSYQLIIEPTYQSWLYTLDTPIKYNGLLDYHNDRLLSSRRVISQKFQYQVTSATKHQHQNNLSAFERNINLQIPPNSNLRSLSLAKQLRDQASSDLNYTQRVLQYFLNNPFSYTLEPPLLPVDPVDNFLFETRAGFCSHFASSFALLMRAGGIPARIVSGYQGGERADSGDYLSVYQYDAHAWNEIWLDNRWVRVDPTATVSPDRINFGLQQAMKDGFLAGELFDLAKYRQFALASWLRDQLNDMDFYWSAWVLNFDTKKQSKLFESLWGKPDTMMFSIYTALIFIGFIGIVYFLARRQHFKHDKTALFLLHRQITIVGRKFDFVLPVSTPPLTYLSELAAAQPQLAGDINALRQDYNRCLYQQLDDEQYTKALANIKRLIKNVKHAAPGPLARISKFRYAR
ncbi:MAG: transglutaminase-like putative cysteine protease [Alteromonadaceae bacterium]